MKRFVSVLMIVMLGIFLVAGSASALSMRLTQGIDTVTITDGGAGDLNSLLGGLTYIGSVGAFNLNVSTGLSKPVVGNPPVSVQMDLNSISTSNSNGTLLIELSDTGFTLNDLDGTYWFVSQIGGTTEGTMDYYDTYIDYSNVLFGQSPANLITSLGPFGSGAFSGSASGSVASTNDVFAFTQAVQITHSGAGTTSFNAILTVPDASIMWLLGTAFIALGFWGRKKSHEQL